MPNLSHRAAVAVEAVAAAAAAAAEAATAAADVAAADVATSGVGGAANQSCILASAGWHWAPSDSSAPEKPLYGIQSDAAF